MLLGVATVVMVSATRQRCSRRRGMKLNLVGTDHISAHRNRCTIALHLVVRTLRIGGQLATNSPGPVRTPHAPGIPGPPQRSTLVMPTVPPGAERG